SDQFSFGAILYELATGERAFRKSNVLDTLSAIVHEEPSPIRDISPRTPAPLGWAVERCLAKEPTDRYASTKDLACDLSDLRDRLTISGDVLPSPTTNRRSPRRWLVAAAVLLAGVAIGVFGSRGSREEPPRYRQVTFRAGDLGYARFAPDGK